MNDSDRAEKNTSPQREPNPDWSKATGEQGCEMLLAMRPGRNPNELTQARREIPPLKDGESWWTEEMAKEWGKPWPPDKRTSK